jgi:hypothetical protein
VHDRVDTARKRSLEQRAIPDVALNEVDRWIRVGIEVDDPDSRAVARELRHDMAPDEAGATGD